MENESEPILRFLLILLFLPSTLLLANTSSADLALDYKVDAIIEYAEDEVKERLDQLDLSLLDRRFDAAVRKQIKRHLRHPRQTAINVGRAIALFPIIEKSLAEAGLPLSLKYLPVVESSLRPWVSSRVGARGLWQFMPETAPEYGLRIDEFVDERMDVQRSTEAAIRYLTSAYDYLEDWSLAIASYNAGKGRVNRAKRRSGGKNFWSVRNHLPKETRDYVPAFIAAIYLTEFYAAHEVKVEAPSLDEQLLSVVKVDYPLSFYQLAQVTGLSIDLIEQLNPSYLKGFLPAYEGGHHIIIPTRVSPALNTYLNEWASHKAEPFLPWTSPLQLNSQPGQEQDYQQYEWLVGSTDSLGNIASYTDCSSSQLAIWNQLTPLDTLMEGQSIVYYKTVQYTYLPSRQSDIIEQFLPSNFSPIGVQSLHHSQVSLAASPNSTRYIQLEKKEKLSDLAKRLEQVSLNDLLRLNTYAKNKPLAAGTIVRIPNLQKKY